MGFFKFYFDAEFICHGTGYFYIVACEFAVFIVVGEGCVCAFGANGNCAFVVNALNQAALRIGGGSGIGYGLRGAGGLAGGGGVAWGSGLGLFATAGGKQQHGGGGKEGFGHDGCPCVN